MNILVTGGIGYIGSHTVVELLENHHTVITIDNLSNSKIEVLDKTKQITGKDVIFYPYDLLEKERVEEVFKKHRIDAVIHFAGLKAVGESVEKPLFYYHNNITGTLHLLEVMKEYNVKKLVFSSSATVYGIDNISPLTEDMKLSAINPYGKTKLFIEEILNDLSIADSTISIVNLRYFNPIGAHQSGIIGEDPRGIPNNLLPYVSQVAVGKLEKVQVFGNDYDTVDGTGVRDYIHIVDLANGHIKALEYCMNHTGIESINLGTGKGYSVLEIIKTFERVNRIKIPYEFVGRRSGDIAVCFANPNKAKQLLNWEAKHSLQDMVRDAWRYQKNK